MAKLAEQAERYDGDGACVVAVDWPASRPGSLLVLVARVYTYQWDIRCGLGWIWVNRMASPWRHGSPKNQSIPWLCVCCIGGRMAYSVYLYVVCG